jgi:hypothetical protein
MRKGRAGSRGGPIKARIVCFKAAFWVAPGGIFETFFCDASVWKIGSQTNLNMPFSTTLRIASQAA